MNSIYNALNKPSAPVSNQMMGMLQQFNQFKRSFRGDPEQIVKDLIRTGKMSESQYEAIAAQANSLYSIFNR